LNVLAGETTSEYTTGVISVNNEKIIGSQLKEISGFVFQDDIILPTMTVKEGECITQVKHYGETLLM
jgi:ATP-binding cassette subfamily G (WHITE) protein 1